jgi:hypothetical protein
MEKSEMLWIASVAWAKDMDYETLKYSDYMYGKQEFLDEVWEYVEELNDFGSIKFYEKYKDYKLY